jgi:hypothetical protein
MTKIVKPALKGHAGNRRGPVRRTQQRLGIPKPNYLYVTQRGIDRTPMLVIRAKSSMVNGSRQLPMGIDVFLDLADEWLRVIRCS